MRSPSGAGALLLLVGPQRFERWCRRAGLEGREGEILPVDCWEGRLRRAKDAGKADLFLVTVRPAPERLWLVAVLERARLVRGRWVASTNRAPIVDLGSVVPALAFASGHVPLVTEDRGAAARTLLRAAGRSDLAPDARVDAALGLALLPESPDRERALGRLSASRQPAVRFAAALGMIRGGGGKATAAAERAVARARRDPDSLGAYEVACFGGRVR